jgi:hypothetical protein
MKTRRAGFTLVELVVSVGLFMVAVTIALVATVGTNSLIARTDFRSAIAESSRSVTDAMRRLTENAPVGTVTLHGYYNEPDAYAGVRVKAFSGSQAQNTCEVIGRATASETASGEETYTLDVSGNVIAYWVYRVDSSLQCPELSTAPLYQNRLTSNAVKASEFLVQLNSYDCHVSANCANKQHLRYRFTVELAAVQSGRAAETRSSSSTVASSLPIGLFGTGVFPVNIVTTALPDGQVGNAYYKEILGEGGELPYDWSHTGDLGGIGGLTLTQADNKYILQGTPLNPGQVSLTVTLGDGGNPQQSDQQLLTLNITQGQGSLLITSNSPLPNGTKDLFYSFDFQASGGTPPYSWGVLSGNLPPGLNLQSSGTLNGTPSAEGTYVFTVVVFDSAEGSHSKEFSLTIGGVGGPGGPDGPGAPGGAL